MVNKSKEKRRARKRQLSNTKTENDLQVIEVSLQKKRLLEEECSIIQASSMENSKEEFHEILPTREVIGTQLTTAVRNRHLAIVEGPLGCGKTFIVRHTARTLNLPVNVMQMGDQIDSKTLFGSYHCTEVAGQFVWKESTFSSWLKSACIVLLEDIDAANADVVSKIVEIASSRQTDPSNPERNIVFNDQLRIVATMSGKGRKTPVLDGIPVRIKLESLSDDELKRLASKLYPRISHLVKTLISIFRKLETVPGSGNSRILTSTDFLRGCARLSKLKDISVNVETFAELVDTWCLSDTRERSLELCNRVAGALNVNQDRVYTHLSVRQPDIKYDDESISIGRAHLARKLSMIKTGRHRLGHTRDVVQLMERIMVCVTNNEPLLLVGETGVGKTSVVQAVADLAGIKLDVVNVSPTSDSDELIQGYKPTTIGRLMEPFTKFYMEVFSKNFDVSKNQTFIDNLEKCLSTGRFRDYLKLVESTATRALERKKGKKDESWAELIVRSKQIREGIEKGAAPFILQKGAVLEAAEKGHWLLVDEINLAPPECLDAIVHALSTPGSHPNFRLFACMNPATDAGKRRLPPSVRAKFTEFFVSETNDPHQLALIVSAYLPTFQQANVSALVNFYIDSKKLYPSRYSLRTLCRALLFTADNMFGSVEQSIFEAVSMAFLTNLEDDEKSIMKAKIQKNFKCSSRPMPSPKNAEKYVKIGGYFIEKGTLLPEEDNKYVMTKTVKSNMAEISRIVCSGRFPILLEGETSAGKTSIVCFLGKVTGNKIVRINNHEHTDVQEYMGSYVADSGGRLVFREGALVQAVRDGSWVILDELNLAPTDVIEALNRLLDDNRELYVPEINETIKAHPRFRLFATQNPAGSYAGRKRLSRALMSRFIVLKFHHLPIDELSEMVCARCSVPSSAANKMIEVLNELRNRRSLSGLFSARDGLMTLRDVFRWAKRMTTDETCDDWLQILVNHGYFLLAGRCRNENDEQTVVETLEKVMKRKIEKEKLFSMSSVYMPKNVKTDGVVLTLGMRRMLVLTEQAWERNEAVLLIGETGGGKTTLSEMIGRGKLRSINCHERTETADLLGRLRPKQDGGFEWSDGVVISAMRDGVPLLIDEISLAEDSVLERLNPLFEENRELLLSDAGTEMEVIQSKQGFQMIATMNPGGDYGKKELSKALRNRFTEVWTANDYTKEDLVQIFDQRLSKVEATRDEIRVLSSQTAKAIVNWIDVFFEKYGHIFRHPPSVRDVVACAELYSSARSANIASLLAVKDAICAVFLDSLAGLTGRLNCDAEEVLEEALKMLLVELKNVEAVDKTVDFENSQLAYNLFKTSVNIQVSSTSLNISHIKIPFGTKQSRLPKGFSLNAPTCAENLYRIARGLLINKPILLEGAPGCGKSSTVMALAQITGNPITRLNLSDQTDLSDLFGSDVPMLTNDGTMTFRWEDGPVLKAIKRGEWVLLDEMNLASQSVLEGLNACFDHRRVLYIAELNRSFEIPSTSNCRFFACQNPRAQGGNRRALPKSFVNRFTNIYTNDLTKEDIEIIISGVDRKNLMTENQRKSMVKINEECAKEAERMTFEGGPHSFNLRDLLRWYELGAKIHNLGEAFELVYVSRLRRDEDRDFVRSIYEKNMNEKCVYPSILLTIDENILKLGKTLLKRKENHKSWKEDENRLVASQMIPMHQIATCVEMNWLALIVAPRNSGKRTIIENLACLTGNTLKTLSLNADTDAQELIGSYEQIVDENCLPKAKNQILEQLKLMSCEKYSKRVENCEDLVKLAVIVEIIIAENGENEKLRQIMEEANRNSMRFVWVDSMFVDAYLKGDWLLIEDVNLCSAAVLDRLNSCLESGGKLVVAERQNSYKPLEPHPEFRVFLSMDARVGEISRAMRNRSVEIYMDENSRWNTSQHDIQAILNRNVSLEMCEQFAEHLNAEQQLHLGVLINFKEFSAEVASKLVGLKEKLTLMSEKNEESNFIRIEDVRKMKEGKYEKWLISKWKKAAKEAKLLNIEGLLMVVLGSTDWMLNKEFDEEWEQIFGKSTMESLFKRVRTFLTGSRHLIDGRFNGGKEDSKRLDQLKKFNTAVIFEWMLQLVSKIVIEGGSAENLSKKLTKYEIATCDVTFTNLPLISKLVSAILDTWKHQNILANDESCEFSMSLALLMLVAASRRKLTTRVGCAAIYLAWNDLRKEMEKCGSLKLPENLHNIGEKMNKGWTLESYETFVNEYLMRWRKCGVALPFETKEKANEYLERIEQILNEDIEDVEMIDLDEDEHKRKIEIDKSPLEVTTKFVNSVEAIFEFLGNGEVEKADNVFKLANVFNGVNWNHQTVYDWIRKAALFCAELMENEKNDDENSVVVTDLISIGGSAHCTATRLFFSALHYNPSLSNLSIAHLQKFSIRELGQKMWRMAINNWDIREKLRTNVESIGRGIEGWIETRNDGNISNEWKNRLKNGIQMMRNALPPPETLDPVIFEEERVLFVRAKKRIIEKQLKLLKEWRKLIGRQDSNCDNESSHPIIRQMQQLKLELDDLEESYDDINEKKEIYRQSATQYNSLCAELGSFLKVAIDQANDAENEADFIESEQKMAIRLARIKSFAMSAANFRTSILRKFVSFIDVSLPFISGLLLVEIGLNEIGLKWKQRVKRLNAETSSAFPRRVTIQIDEDGLESNEVTTWSIRDSSPMGLSLKSAVVRKRLEEIAKNNDMGDAMFIIQWTRNQWKKWYERNIAKDDQKDFVYRNKTEEEKDEMDLQEFFGNEERNAEVLSEDEVSLLLEAIDEKSSSLSLVDEKTKLVCDSNYQMAKSWMRYLMSEVGYIPNDDLSLILCVDGEQKLFEKISKSEGLSNDIEGEDRTIVNVYRNSSLRECRKLVTILEKLAKRTKEVLERWPEVVSLKQIVETIDEFFAVTVSIPHIKLSLEVEKLIELCEQWEIMADRNNSLRDPLGDLRKLLVEWKKMEVRCWSSLLKNCENEVKQKTQLVAFPLFESLFLADTSEKESAIIPMSIEWMHNSTIVDFRTRVECIGLLAKWAKICGKMVLGEQLSSAARHFGIFVEKVEKRLKEAREPAEKSLKDYLNVVKYNDLNLWNIRVSSQRAHSQLYKIVRRFKAAMKVEVDEDFEELQKVDEWKRNALEHQETKLNTEEIDEDVERRVRNGWKYVNKIIDQVKNVCNTEQIEELIEQTVAADESIRTMINYIGEDEEKEKQQGYARNSRQRQVAMVIKEAQSIGFNARRAVLLEQEIINRRSIIEVKNGGSCEKNVRICAAGRNVVLKRANKVDEQVGIATRKHFGGMIEYGMWQILNLQENIEDWKKDSEKMRKLAKTMEIVGRNRKNNWNIEHEKAIERIGHVGNDLKTISTLIQMIRSRLAEIPEQIEESLLEKNYLHPLSRLVKSDELAEKLRSWAEGLETMGKNMKEVNQKILNENEKIIEREAYLTWSNEILSSVQEMKNEVSRFDGFFNVERKAVLEKLDGVNEKVQKLELTETEIEKEMNIDKFLLIIQEVYKKLEKNETEKEEKKSIDRIDELVKLLKSVNVKNVVEQMEQSINEQVSGEVKLNGIQVVSEFGFITSRMIDGCVVELTNSLARFIELYRAVLSLTIQLYEKGYVNGIPKPEKQESGEGETDNSGEGGGMGEGGTAKDAKDVTDEMEETGQIEGLEDEQPADSEEHEAKNENEKPIEMDDDFAEDLQDIDKNDKGDQEDEKDNDDEEEEPEIEDQMGEVEEEDEKQLDPKMWDEDEKEEQEQQKNIDQEQDGADDKTNEMVAKEDEAQPEQGEDGEPKEKEEEEDENQNEEDQENMDERDRENDKRAEDEMDQKEIGKEIEEDAEDVDEDGNEQIEEGDDDETDQEDEVEGKGDENTEEDAEENVENDGINDDETEKKEDEADKMEQGTGGEKKENDEKNDQSDGGAAEDEKKEEDDEEMEEKGQGKSRTDPRGKDGDKGEQVKEKSEEEEKENEDESEEDEKKEKKKELAIDKEKDVDEDVEMGEGEENEKGEQMENSEVSERQMIGKGTIEEARQTKREKKEEERKERKKLNEGVKDEAGIEGGEIEGGEEVEEEKQAKIHISGMEIEDVTNEKQENEMIVGIVDEEKNEKCLNEQVGEKGINEKADEQWVAMSKNVGILAAELAENLRLILEPQRANKMQGDYRSGKRLNMRRLIPYIASEYRKDRIWMRRTKKAQREYQILIAVDDSGSMNENGIHENTCESVCIVEDALRRCDAGRVSVCSFGSDVETIIPFGEGTSSSSVEMLKRLTFDQNKTDLLLLLKTARQQLEEIRTATSEQMLIIISDGRGALAQGIDKVRALYSNLQGVTVLFIILDSGKKSIEELSVASFKDGKVVLTPYLSMFPFPFYAIVKTIQQLPSVIAESIRQWFEMTTHNA